MSSGSKTDYYNISTPNETIDVDYICEAYGFTFAEGNAFKALVGIAKARGNGETRHKGTDAKRDANKLIHYAQLIQTLAINADDGEEVSQVDLGEIYKANSDETCQVRVIS